MLDEIVKNKRTRLEEIKVITPLEELKKKSLELPPARNFKGALAGDGISLIAEVKKASPSAGVIRADFDPIAIAETYEKEGACAISVLTEERYFKGDLIFLAQIKKFTSIPILRKDFIFDEYQVYESRLAGADAQLLIAAILGKRELARLILLGNGLGLHSLVEAHTEDEIRKSVEAGAEIIGINNRNLATFKVDISTTEALIDRVPEDKTVVSESGISTRKDVEALQNAGADAILVGESLLRSRDIESKVRELLGKQ